MRSPTGAPRARVISSLLDGIVCVSFRRSRSRSSRATPSSRMRRTTARRAGQALLDCIERCYADFRQRVGSRRPIWPCWCEACANDRPARPQVRPPRRPVRDRRRSPGATSSSARGGRRAPLLKSTRARRSRTGSVRARHGRASSSSTSPLTAASRPREATVTARQRACLRLPEPRRSDHLDEPGVAGVVDLERRVLDPELVVEQPLELAAPAVAVLAGPDEDVRRERREARRDRPDVEVVHLDDARRRREPRARAPRRRSPAASTRGGSPSSRAGSTTRSRGRARR